ncbi:MULTISPECIES: L-methionine/branched-chain amino acid transporter [Pseudomonas]|uniref:L-methionine/branched-chain amino acid transporter n=1 Tax=Pseudomonas TaxID=286 RepID=UPI00257F6BF4|nr:MULTISPECIES: L-methionine/branched-chain amino acid transporter [Pseudomonas]
MSRLNKELGLLQGIALLATSLLGTGIFVVPALAASSAGIASLWAWPLLILLVLPVAFTFAQLGRRFPHAGGAPHLIGRAFGLRFERVSAWLFLAVIPVGVPAALHIGVGFWQSVFAITPGQALAIQLGTLAIILLLGQRPMRASGSLQAAIAVAIVACIALIWWAGDLPDASLPLLNSAAPDWSRLPTALAVMFWCFVGIEAFAHLGEEFRRPQRDFPLALLLGTLLAGLVYWACSLAVLNFGHYGDAQRDATSLPDLVGQLFGERGRWLLALLGYLACFASTNVYLLGFARLLWSLADEGKAPAGLARLNRHGVPSRALLLIVACCALCSLASSLLSLSVDELIRYANGNFVLIYLLSMAAGWVLLEGLWRWLAGLSVALCALVLVALGVQALYALALLGVLVALHGRRPPRRAAATQG